jgi:hypothetical protein
MVISHPWAGKKNTHIYTHWLALYIIIFNQDQVLGRPLRLGPPCQRGCHPPPARQPQWRSPGGMVQNPPRLSLSHQPRQPRSATPRSQPANGGTMLLRPRLGRGASGSITTDSGYLLFDLSELHERSSSTSTYSAISASAPVKSRYASQARWTQSSAFQSGRPPLKILLRKEGSVVLTILVGLIKS